MNQRERPSKDTLLLPRGLCPKPHDRFSIYVKARGRSSGLWPPAQIKVLCSSYHSDDKQRLVEGNVPREMKGKQEFPYRALSQSDFLPQGLSRRTSPKWDHCKSRPWTHSLITSKLHSLVLWARKYPWPWSTLIRIPPLSRLQEKEKQTQNLAFPLKSNPLI